MKNNDVSDIEPILYGFLQAAFFGEAQCTAKPDFEAALKRLSRCRSLQARTLCSWPAPDRSALGEMLKSWLIVERLQAMQGQPLPYHDGFTHGSSSTRLGEPFVAYILNRADDLQGLYQGSQKAGPDPQT